METFSNWLPLLLLTVFSVWLFWFLRRKDLEARRRYEEKEGLPASVPPSPFRKLPGILVGVAAGVVAAILFVIALAFFLPSHLHQLTAPGMIVVGVLAGVTASRLFFRRRERLAAKPTDQ